MPERKLDEAMAAAGRAVRDAGPGRRSCRASSLARDGALSWSGYRAIVPGVAKTRGRCVTMRAVAVTKGSGGPLDRFVPDLGFRHAFCECPRVRQPRRSPRQARRYRVAISRSLGGF